MSEASNQQKLQKLNKDGENNKSKDDKPPKWNSSSSSFLSSLTTHNSSGDDRHSSGNKNKKKAAKKRPKKKKKNGLTHNTDNNGYSIHNIEMKSIQATYQTSKTNILQAYNLGGSQKHKSNIKKFLSNKTYNKFKGETTIYDYVIDKRAFNKFVNNEIESGMWWPTGAPCDVKIYYEAKNGMIVDKIKLFFVYTDDKGVLHNLDFKKCEDKHTSIFFLVRVFQSDHDLIPKIVYSLNDEAFYILQKTLISILKGWNVYLVCDLEFIDTCLEIYKSAHGSTFYYINRPMVRLVNVQSNLECKNCQGHASKFNMDGNAQDINSSIRNISLSNESQEVDISSDEFTAQETSVVIKEPIIDERSSTRSTEPINPKQMAFEYLSNLNKK